MKKLLILNLIILTVLFCAIVAPDYYINYAVYDSSIFLFIGVDWLTVLGILLGGTLLSALLASIILKRLTYIDRFLKISIFFNMAFLFFISYHATLAILSAKREYEVLLSEYRRKAESDIKNGLIAYETAGMPILLDSVVQAREDKIDSLRRSYGLATRNMGCLITAPLLKAQDEYKRLTAPYLNRRNGLGWQQRMDEQIKSIRKGQF